MCVPLAVNDFLYRAEAVSAYAAAVVDEPVQPAAPARTTPTPSCSLASAGGNFLRRGVAEGDEGAGLAGGAATPSVAGGNTEGG